MQLALIIPVVCAIPKANIADELQLRDEQSVDNNFNRIIRDLRGERGRQKWILRKLL